MSRLPVLPSDPELADPIPLGARGVRGVPGWLRPSDRQGRGLRYLRLSVTDRCDLRCVYCMPVEGAPASPREEVLTLEELARVARLFARLGVTTVRLTGGEPLVRKDVAVLVRMIRDDAGITDIAMSTNGSALTALAGELVKNGLARINVSVDSLRPEVFRRMTRGGELSRVLDGIAAIRAAGLGPGAIKINTVVVRGENDDEAGAIVDWAWAHGLVPRFIELMPLGEGAHLGPARVVPSAELRRRLGARLGPEPLGHRQDRGPATYYPAADHRGHKVGFIGAVTENFCERCNRVRVTARGDIRACLASPDGLSLKELMRAGEPDAALVERIERALFAKRDGHRFHLEGETAHQQVAMSRVGG
jgi:cyclic pyranopterin phosphate synthase